MLVFRRKFQPGGQFRTRREVVAAGFQIVVAEAVAGSAFPGYIAFAIAKEVELFLPGAEVIEGGTIQGGVALAIVKEASQATATSDRAPSNQGAGPAAAFGVVLLELIEHGGPGSLDKVQMFVFFVAPESFHRGIVYLPLAFTAAQEKVV
jgi:hypothetical protein